MIITVLTGLAFVLATVTLILGCYFGMRWATGGGAEEKTHELASSVIFRISAMHGLILALIFAQETVQYQQLRTEAALEANAVADIFFDAKRYGAAGTEQIQQATARYTREVVEGEWEIMRSSARLSGAAWAAWDDAYTAILNLTPQTDREESLRDNMLAKIHRIAELRNRRESHETNSVDYMFWFAALSGVVLISLAYYSYEPRRHNLVLISLFAVFTGIILFFLYAFSNPFAEPGRMSHRPFERLLEHEIGSFPTSG